MELIDGEIGPSFASLRKQREAAGSAYYDAATYAQGSFARVPEALRPKPGRLSVGQQRVYDVKSWASFSLKTLDFFFVYVYMPLFLSVACRILSGIYGKISLVRVQVLFLLVHLVWVVDQ